MSCAIAESKTFNSASSRAPLCLSAFAVGPQCSCNVSCAQLASANAPASRSGKQGWLVTRASTLVRLPGLGRFGGRFTRAESKARTRQVGDNSRFKSPLMNMLFVSSITTHSLNEERVLFDEIFLLADPVLHALPLVLNGRTAINQRGDTRSSARRQDKFAHRRPQCCSRKKSDITSVDFSRR